jgi:hypothetical protein
MAGLQFVDYRDRLVGSRCSAEHRNNVLIHHFLPISPQQHPRLHTPSLCSHPRRSTHLFERSPRHRSTATPQSQPKSLHISTMADKEFTYSDVSEHTTKKDLYMVIHDKVYDASSFVDEHPYVGPFYLRHTTSPLVRTRRFETPRLCSGNSIAATMWNGNR